MEKFSYDFYPGVQISRLFFVTKYDEYFRIITQKFLAVDILENVVLAADENGEDIQNIISYHFAVTKIIISLISPFKDI